MTQTLSIGESYQEGGDHWMAQTVVTKNAPRERISEKYHEPLLIKHEPLLDVTGQKYAEKNGGEKMGNEAG